MRRTEAEKAKFYRKEEDEVKVRLTLCILSSTLPCPPFCIRLHTHALARLTESFARNIFLQRMLFALFAKHEYYTIDNLYQQTEQPKVSLNPRGCQGLCRKWQVPALLWWRQCAVVHWSHHRNRPPHLQRAICL